MLLPLGRQRTCHYHPSGARAGSAAAYKSAAALHRRAERKSIATVARSRVRWLHPFAPACSAGRGGTGEGAQRPAQNAQGACPAGPLAHSRQRLLAARVGRAQAGPSCSHTSSGRHAAWCACVAIGAGSTNAAAALLLTRTMSTVSSGSAASGPTPVPLKAVVQAAVSACASHGTVPPAWLCSHGEAVLAPPGRMQAASPPALSPCATRLAPRAVCPTGDLPPPPPPPTRQVRRWFEDCLAEAQRGDVKQQALVAQMYESGYGCARNPKAAAEWADKARARGYRMKGVYCEL